eukprot:gnl/MRDRNA2_/MRDRNA2_62419_c0_seq2.p1 gnl/MRDRNA2_/MRDRNA2_62419_c0~~gnl/MRDRNA2_/MRDRNA2_62419_c0_seq2.p1  ORF type:complete len:944 (+),score=233.87 gnl/MRDRNA2_/MRDRNA2_62419_c0_seq2:74-2905(+)
MWVDANHPESIFGPQVQGLQKLSLNEDGSLPDGLEKEVLQKAQGIGIESWPQPRSGDEISVVYQSWTGDGELVNPDRDISKALSWVLGSGTKGRAVRGLELGLMTMKKGEKARLTVPPAYAFGSQQYGKIKPDTTLIYEVELLWFSNKKDMFGDGKCIATTRIDGDKFSQGPAYEVQDGVVVILDYVVSASGKTLDERRSFEYKFRSTDDLGLINHRVIDRFLEPSRRGEEATFSITDAEYAYGADAPLSKQAGADGWTVELVMKEVCVREDCSFSVDCEGMHFIAENVGQVIKERRKGPTGEDAVQNGPMDGSKVVLRVYGAAANEVGGHQVLEADAAAEKTEGLEFEVIAGDGELCDGLECALWKMAKGERANVFVMTDLCRAGLPRLSLDVAEGFLGEEPEKIVFDVELVSFEDSFVSTQEMKEKERVEYLRARKDVGSKLFQQGRFWLARERFINVGVLIQQNFNEFFDIQDNTHRTELLNLQRTLWLNLAQTELKLKRWEAAVEVCDIVLKDDPDNAKALYRRASAMVELEDAEAAVVSLKRLLVSDSDNSDVKRLLNRAQQLRKKANSGQKGFYSNMMKKSMDGHVADERAKEKSEKQKHEEWVAKLPNNVDAKEKILKQAKSIAPGKSTKELEQQAETLGKEISYIGAGVKYLPDGGVVEVRNGEPTVYRSEAEYLKSRELGPEPPPGLVEDLKKKEEMVDDTQTGFKGMFDKDKKQKLGKENKEDKGQRGQEGQKGSMHTHKARHPGMRPGSRKAKWDTLNYAGRFDHIADSDDEHGDRVDYEADPPGMGLFPGEQPQVDPSKWTPEQFKEYLKQQHDIDMPSNENDPKEVKRFQDELATKIKTMKTQLGGNGNQEMPFPPQMFKDVHMPAHKGFAGSHADHGVNYPPQFPAGYAGSQGNQGVRCPPHMQRDGMPKGQKPGTCSFAEFLDSSDSD